jgi:hypothetical protein
MNVGLVLDGVEVGQTFLDQESSVGWFLPFQRHFPLEIATTGEHTLEVYVRTATGQQWDIKTGATVFVHQTRGGLVPVQQDSVGVIDTPRALNFLNADVVATVSGVANITLPTDIQGIEVVSYTMPSPVTISDTSWADVTGVTKTFTVGEGETVKALFKATWRENDTGSLALMRLRFAIDGVGDTDSQQAYQVDVNNTAAFAQLEHYFTNLTAGSHTIQLEGKVNSDAAQLDSTPGGEVGILWIIRYKGGYTKAQNLPLTDGVSGDTFNMVAQAGADAELRMLLNDGAIYRVNAPYAMDVGTNGAGGLEGSLTATASTPYFIYAVPDPSNPGQAIFVMSDQDPDPNNDNGPANYDVWSYCGFVYYMSTSALRQVHQEGDTFYFPDPQETALALYEGAASNPPVNTWYTFNTGSAAGGVGTQRAISAALPTNIVGSVRFIGGLDTDTGDTIMFGIDSYEHSYTLNTLWPKRMAWIWIDTEELDRATFDRWVPLHNNDCRFRWETLVGSGFDWCVVLRGYTDKFLTPKFGGGATSVVREREAMSPTVHTSSFDARVGINRVNISGGDVTGTLPAANTMAGKTVEMMITATNPSYELTVTDGGSFTEYLQAEATSTFYSDGSSWYWKKRGQMYIDRGDMSSFDLTNTGMTRDGSYYDWDISSIIPNAAKDKMVKFYIFNSHSSWVETFLRENGNSNQVNTMGGEYGASGISSKTRADVKCDANGIMEYKVTSAAGTQQIVVLGWWVDV